jgi:hypothetical protein
MLWTYILIDKYALIYRRSTGQWSLDVLPCCQIRLQLVFLKFSMYHTIRGRLYHHWEQHQQQNHHMHKEDLFFVCVSWKIFLLWILKVNNEVYCPTYRLITFKKLPNSSCMNNIRKDNVYSAYSCLLTSSNFKLRVNKNYATFLGSKYSVSVSCLSYYSILKIEETYSCGTSVDFRWLYIPEDKTL